MAKYRVEVKFKVPGNSPGSTPIYVEADNERNAMLKAENEVKSSKPTGTTVSASKVTIIK